jgi:hypothetical protein
MPFIAFVLDNQTKLVNVDAIREAIFDDKNERLTVTLAGNHEGVKYFMEGPQAREAFERLKNL